jgi:radical SAM protein with 4Fe4S-binding SPASM domain
MRRRIQPGRENFAPLYVVWELTLQCDLACRHCGSRAGKARRAELTRDEALAVVDQLAALGTREIAFIGGEAYLNPSWLDIVAAASAAGIRPTMATGGRELDDAKARAAKEAGMQAVSVSVDGLETTHDTLRAVRGSWRRAMAAIGHVRGAGMEPYANTQWNQLNLPEVEALGERLLDAGMQAWQIQITGPMGRAADRPEWLLQPFQMLELVDRIGAFAETARARGCTISAANNLGYFGPWEHRIRIEPFGGCSAGRYLMGIESNGDIKGCPSLPSAPYVAGNVRDTSIAELWNHGEAMRFARDRDETELWGFCGGCYYKKVCRGGCSWTAHTLLGKRGNMPFCYHRADELRKQGQRERLVQVERAPGEPFDFGRFELVLEPFENG